MDMLSEVCRSLCRVSTVTRVSAPSISAAVSTEARSVSAGVVCAVFREDREVAGVIVIVEGLADGPLEEREESK